MAEKIREKAKVTQMARKAQPLSAFVRKKIEDMVMSGELGGGDWLNENALATELSVSRGPVREATQALAEAGLLIINGTEARSSATSASRMCSMFMMFALGSRA